MTRRAFNLVVGAHPVGEWLRSSPGDVIEVLVEAPGSREARAVANEARARGVEVRVLSAAVFRDLVQGRAFQGVAARVAPFRYADEHEVFQRVLADPPGLGVALDSVQDPQNLGSVLRTSAFFGVRGVILPKDRAAPVTPAVVRTSAGAAARVPVAQVTNLARTLRAWREAGVRVVGCVAHGGRDPAEAASGEPTVLVLGSEHEGLRRLVRESCDVLVTIASGDPTHPPSPSVPGGPTHPLSGGFESLNVGVAAGILIHMVMRGRTAR